jgi:cytochrome c-type biogenesis protein
LENVSYLLAFSAGLLSFLSPCILPLVPAYLTYLTGSQLKEITEKKIKIKAFWKAVGFVIGFSFIFILMGVTVTGLGAFLVDYWHIFIKISGILIILLGLHMIGVFKLTWLYKEKRFSPALDRAKPFSSVLIGMAFAAGWTPCVGPILSAILIYAGSMDTMNKGMMLLVFYSLGMSLPFLIAALMIDKLAKLLKKVSRILPVISIISGILLVILGILIFTENMSLLIQYFDLIPAL